MVFMENKNDEAIELALLPDGQVVRIEKIHSDGYATVRRTDGEWKGMVAVCAVSSLQFRSEGCSLNGLSE